MRGIYRAACVPLVLALFAACSTAAASPTASGGGAGPSGSPPASDKAPSASVATKAPSTPEPTPTSAPTATPGLSKIPLLSFHIPPVQLHGAYLLIKKDTVLGAELWRPDMWIVKPDGTGLKKLAEGTAHGPLSPPNYNIWGVWAHDGSTVHVVKGCESRLSDVSVAGVTTPKAVMTDKDEGFVWSADDKRVAYWHFTSPDVICEQNGSDTMLENLMVMNPDGTSKSIVLSGVEAGLQAYSWMAGNNLFASNNGSWVKVNVAGGSVTSLSLTSNRAKLSPDGLRIAYLNAGKVWVRGLMGGVSVNLGTGSDFAWSPDGKYVAVCGSTLRIVDSVTAAGNMVYNATTSSPTWSPDAKRVAFLRGTAGVWVVNASGGGSAFVPYTSGASSVEWQP